MKLFKGLLSMALVLVLTLYCIAPAMAVTVANSNTRGNGYYHPVPSSVNEALNVPGGTLEFNNPTGWHIEHESETQNYYASPRYRASGTSYISYISLTGSMSVDYVLSFELRTDNFDPATFFEVEYNLFDPETPTYEGLLTVRETTGWTRYEYFFNAEQFPDYDFSWNMYCSAENQGLSSGIYVRNVSVAPATTTNALSMAGYPMNSSTPTDMWAFTPTMVGTRYCLKSSNLMEHNTSSMLCVSIEAYVGSIFSFDYLISSEQDYDVLNIYVNDLSEPIFTDSGIKDWQSYTYEFTESGIYSIYIEYHKDESYFSGDDRLLIDDMFISPYMDYSHALNTGEYFANITPANDNDWYIVYYLGDDNLQFAAETNIRGVDWGIADMETSVYLMAGAEVTFDYCTETEETCDEFFFIVNGMALLEASGSLPWQTYSYIAPADGLYNLTWRYQKDGGEDYGYDCATIANVSIPLAAKEAAIAKTPEDIAKLSVNVTPLDSYPWDISYYGGSMCLASTNQGMDMSSSILNISVTAAAGDVYSCDLFISCEEDYDGLEIYVDGVMTNFISPQGDTQIKHTFTIENTGVTEITYRYAKDTSDAYGADTVVIDNVHIEGGSGYEQGDVNMDGSVSTTDALMILRNALSLVMLTEQQTELGDMNGDTHITTIDALAVLRITLGL